MFILLAYSCWDIGLTLKIVIEEYKPPVKSNGKPVKNQDKFFLPPIPWKWTLYNGFKVITFGYTHTEEDAELAANKAINRYSPFRA